MAGYVQGGIMTLLGGLLMVFNLNGAEAYLAALLENAIPDDVTSKASLLKLARIVSELLRRVESLYGTYIGVELIESIRIAKSTRVVYFVASMCWRTYDAISTACESLLELKPATTPD